MGISLGQLPPAELARLKAELAETLVAHFCYPRFFDYRTESLRMRPVDRAKRQEVWLYLSSVDFTAWSRVDLMSPDFQRYIERLLVQFVQRNRSFFGEQGRRRMSDIRMLIGSSATSIVQALRAHLTGQRQDRPFPFGSPRPVVTWSTPALTGQPDPAWEQIAANTVLLQQQLQELRGEMKPPAPGEAQAVNGSSRRPTRLPLPGASTPFDRTAPAAQQPSTVVSKPAPRVSPASDKPVAQVNTGTATAPTASVPPSSSTPSPTASKDTAPARPASAVSSSTPSSSTAAPVASPASVPIAASVRKSGLAAPQESPVAAAPVILQATAASGVSTPSKQAELVPPAPSPAPVQPPPAMSIAGSRVPSTPLAPIQARSLPPSAPPPAAPSASATAPGAVSGQRDNPVMRIGEDDVAIFEQMRHQLLIWLRIEAVQAGIELSGQGAPQLLELLRQQVRVDETRLQVVSTLLNLANQVIKSGQVSVLDYKQALMFHLMHTRR